MDHKKASRHKKNKKERTAVSVDKYRPDSSGKAAKTRLEIVLKCDSAGSVEAVRESILGVDLAGVEINIIHAGVGAVNKSDIFLAETGSNLIVGFNVDVTRKLDAVAAQYGIEIRLYDVIYKVTDDIGRIAASLLPMAAGEQTIGSARVIALFKSSRKGIILGCEVLEGHLALGQRFRVISAMGPVYSGKIDSLHIEKHTVQKVTKGQQAGLKIKDFNKAVLGDLVESYRPAPQGGPKPWRPSGGIFRLYA